LANAPQRIRRPHQLDVLHRQGTNKDGPGLSNPDDQRVI